MSEPTRSTGPNPSQASTSTSSVPDPVPAADQSLRTSDQPTITAQSPAPQAKVEPGTSLAGSPSRRAEEAFHDFEILRVLGEGSFGKVYLARQISLDRQVALKVTANRGSEARTLASLEHDHIVHVFSETIDLDRNQRLLCMQYVPGTTLERIIRRLNEQDRHSWGGRAILDCIDGLSQHPAVFHPAALRDRELLGELDYFQAACWIGARLAEALDYAHSQNVLHRDIKPANILVSQYGRPFLADFNISSKSAGDGAGDYLFGGTAAYMAPEHLDALNPAVETPREAVDRRSDIYSLGVVLFELLTGHRPTDLVQTGMRRSEALKRLAIARRAAVPSPRHHIADVPATLDRVVRRCLDPEPDRRYQSGAELARALRGCSELRAAEAELPTPGLLASAILRQPFLWVAILALLPHIVGSVVNISYNSFQIVGALTKAQQQAFGQLVLAYNVVVYPTCVWFLISLALPAFRLWRRLSDSQTVDDRTMAEVRKRVLRWPLGIVALSCVGWLPGGALFPIGISIFAGAVSAEVIGHFLTSFAISGLIALTYSFFGVQFVVLRVFYPRLWTDARDFRQTARSELSRVGSRVRRFQVLAGAIPLAGAVLLVGVGPELSAYRSFRLLVTSLIALGMAGFGLAVQAHNHVSRILASFRGRGD